MTMDSEMVNISNEGVTNCSKVLSRYLPGSSNSNIKPIREGGNYLKIQTGYLWLTS
jgi:hypothetical protein